MFFLAEDGGPKKLLKWFYGTFKEHYHGQKNSSAPKDKIAEIW